MNSLAGLISTLANIYGVQHGDFSTSSKSTLTVTTASTAVFLVFTAFYTFWLVRRVKARHDRQVGKERAGKFGEGVVDVSKRKA
jgi:NADH:ubiquinone oxidoreductase subunit H